MCELLVRVVDKTSDDPYKDVLLTKRGMVIAAMPDNWVWGAQELLNPDWRIIRLPGVSLAQVAPFLAPEVNKTMRTNNRMLRPRGFVIDLEHPNLADIKQHIGESNRRKGKWMKRLDISAAQFVATKVQLAPVDDPAIMEPEQPPYAL